MSRRTYLINKFSLFTVITLFFLMVGCSAFNVPREIRNVDGINKEDTLLALREGFLKKDYRVETISIKDGVIKVVSPEFDRKLLWIIPWRKDRWTVFVCVDPLEHEEGYKISAKVDPEERGVFESSVWKSREQLSTDRNYILDLIQMMESLLLDKGAILK